MKEGIITAIVVVTFVVALFILTVIIDCKSCHAKAVALGYNCEYTVWAGCVFEKEDGTKVLLEQLRDFGDK